ncbi:MAG: glycosyltransferase [Pyrinomonadaceae bacterium]
MRVTKSIAFSLSVWTQSLRKTIRTLEIFVVNDRSTDRTGEIARYAAQQHANLRVIDGAEPPQAVARQTSRSWSKPIAPLAAIGY